VVFFTSAGTISYTSAAISGSSSNHVAALSGLVTATTFPNVYVAAADYSGTVGTVGSGKSAFIANSYHAVTEIDSQGNTVQTIPFDSLSWVFSSVTDVGTLKYASMTATDGTFQVIISPIVSSKLGVTNSGAIVSPNAIELDVEIKNFPFRSMTNRLVLTMGVLIASTTLSSSPVQKGDFHVLSAGSGASQVYFTTASTCTVNGTSAQVEIDVAATTDASFSSIPGLQTEFAALQLSLTVSAKWVNVTMPAGADIHYDPSTGAGPNPLDPGNSSGAGKVALSLSSLFILASLYIM